MCTDEGFSPNAMNLYKYYFSGKYILLIYKHFRDSLKHKQNDLRNSFIMTTNPSKTLLKITTNYNCLVVVIFMSSENRQTIPCTQYIHLSTREKQNAKPSLTRVPKMISKSNNKVPTYYHWNKSSSNPDNVS